MNKLQGKKKAQADAPKGGREREQERGTYDLKETEEACWPIAMHGSYLDSDLNEVSKK